MLIDLRLWKALELYYDSRPIILVTHLLALCKSSRNLFDAQIFAQVLMTLQNVHAVLEVVCNLQLEHLNEVFILLLAFPTPMLG
jgi:hypothetical protein